MSSEIPLEQPKFPLRTEQSQSTLRSYQSSTRGLLQGRRPQSSDNHANASSRHGQSGQSNLILVDWDGPNDPQNPKSWGKGKLLIHLILVSTLCLANNLASTMYAPGAAELAIDFKTRDKIKIALTVSIYLMGFSMGPILFSPLSEVYGRLPIYHISNVGFLAFLFGCAYSTNIEMFIVFRFLSGCFGSVPMTVGGGTIADFTKDPKQNNGSLKFFALGPLLGPIIGPVVGGFVTEYIGWRWTFRLIIIIMGVLTILTFVFMRETSSAVILGRKGKKLTQGTGQRFMIPGPMPGMPPIERRPSKEIALRALLRPLKLLLFLPQVLILSIYTAFVFGLIYLLFTTFPTVFSEQYGFKSGVAGLSYIGIGGGMLIGLFVFSHLNMKMAAKSADPSKVDPESYLPLMVWFSPVLPIGFFWYGWSAYAKVHWIVPILGTFFIGFGCFAIIMPVTSYLVYAHGPPAAASCLAANNILRYLFAAFLPLAGDPMYASLGLGWGNTLLGFLCVAMVPLPLLFQRYGLQLRNKFPLTF